MSYATAPIPQPVNILTGTTICGRLGAAETNQVPALDGFRGRRAGLMIVGLELSGQHIALADACRQSVMVCPCRRALSFRCRDCPDRMNLRLGIVSLGMLAFEQKVRVRVFDADYGLWVNESPYFSLHFQSLLNILHRTNSSLNPSH